MTYLSMYSIYLVTNVLENNFIFVTSPYGTFDVQVRLALAGFFLKEYEQTPLPFTVCCNKVKSELKTELKKKIKNCY